ncbi:MAG: 50S ribosomal protein L24 [Endozoicomonadaceae bacterium]|nr:50S ribosomal protein L24 [Endozoicomonadaceae bacterium]
MNKIRRHDEIVVIAGKDRGKRGKVTQVRSDGRLIVEGVNMVKRHQRDNPGRNQPGEIIEREAPIQISNVAIWNTETEKGDRVGFVFDAEGNKQRIFKSNRKPVDV